MWRLEQARHRERGVVLCRLHSVVRSGAVSPRTLRRFPGAFPALPVALSPLHAHACKRAPT